MPELRKAPTDRLGIPLPIIPSENLLRLDPLLGPLDDSDDNPRDVAAFTRHHEYFLYGTKVFRSMGGIAMRLSRILRAEKEVHNTGPKTFHHFYNLSPGPLDPQAHEDEQAQFNSTLLSISGYIPRQGIDLWSGNPDIRTIEDGELAMLQTIDPYSEYKYRYLRHDYPPIREFFRQFVVKQDLSEANPQLIEDFIATPKISLTREIGHELLQHAIRTAVAPIKDSYTETRDGGQLHPSAPVDAETVVLHALGKELQREKLLPKIRAQLIEQVPIAA